MPDVVVNHLNNVADRSSEDHTLKFNVGSGDELNPSKSPKPTTSKSNTWNSIILGLF